MEIGFELLDTPQQAAGRFIKFIHFSLFIYEEGKKNEQGGKKFVTL